MNNIDNIVIALLQVHIWVLITAAQVHRT